MAKFNSSSGAASPKKKASAVAGETTPKKTKKSAATKTEGAPREADKGPEAAAAAAAGTPKRIRTANRTKPVKISMRATRRMAFRGDTALYHCAPAQINQHVLDALRKTISTAITLNVGAGRVVISTRAIHAALGSKGSLLAPLL